MRIYRLFAAGFAAFGLQAAFAATPADMLRELEATARAATPGFSGLSAERGRKFFNSLHGSDWSCASCHTALPLAPGKHVKTAKEIAPLAPAANPQRFTDLAKTQKWFKRNCNDVLGRACSAEEQGDVLAFLISLAK